MQFNSTIFLYRAFLFFTLFLSIQATQAQEIHEEIRVEVGNLFTLDVDTSAVEGTFDNFTVERCFSILGFADKINDTQIRYEAVELAIDSVCVSVCNTDNLCDTIYYRFVAARFGTKNTENVGEIEIRETVERCLPVSQLYEANYEIRFLNDRFTDQGTTLDITDSCFTFFTGLETDMDTLTMLACDQYVCDTTEYYFDIRKYGSLQETIDTFLPLGASYERCFDIQNTDTFEIRILQDVSDNATVAEIDGFCLNYQTGDATDADTFNVLVRDRYVHDTFAYIIRTEQLGSFQGITDTVIALGGQYDQCFDVEDAATFSLELLDDVSDEGTQLTITDNCFSYRTALTEEADTFRIVECDNYVCDTFEYRFQVEQLGDLIILPTVRVQLGQVYENCLAIQNTTDYSITLQDSNYLDNETLVFFTDSCYRYETGYSPENDTLRFVKKDGLRIDSLVQIFVAETDTLDLPLYDDFSYDSPYPNAAIWISRDALVNKSFGYLPPNVGVITMDGLNRNGSPYNTGFGPADRIISKPIDISEVEIGPDTLQLSFSIQPKGLGESPETTDFVQVEFLDSSNNWIPIDTIITQEFEFDQALSLVSNTALFKTYRYPVLADSFYHDHFQFRIVNFGSNLGAIDIWNIDNIYFNKFFSDRGYRDVSFSKIPQSLLKNYMAMPRKHFEAAVSDQIQEQLGFELSNFFDQFYSLSSSQFTVIEENTGVEVGTTSSFLGAEAVVRPGEPLEDNFLNKPSGDYQTMLNTIDAENALHLTGRLSYQLGGQEQFAYSNDSVSFSNVIDDYFAYDDGTAEYNLAAEGKNVFIAQEFESLVDDTLKNIEMHIQHVNGDVREIEFKLYVWLDSLNTEPVFVSRVLNPIYSDEFNLGLQSFTNYQLKDENDEPQNIFIPKGKFFIGWEQLTDEFDMPMAVGMDHNSSFGHGKIHTKTQTTWNTLNPEVYPGSLMIRAVFGKESRFTTTSEDEPTLEVKLYPNPVEEILYIETAEQEALDYQVYNSQGQFIVTGKLNKAISVAHLQRGVYFVRLIAADTQVSKILTFIKL